MKGIKKTIIATIIGVILISFIIVIIYRNKTNNKISQMLEMVDCTYYRTVKSSEKGYYKDIYVSIPEQPVRSDSGISNQTYYEEILKHVANALEYENYRIIDEQQNLIIRFRYDTEGVKYSINGDTNYFETEKMKIARNLKKPQDNNLTELSPKSSVLNNIVENEWINISNEQTMGTIESTCNNYNYYFNEGYRIRTINNKIYNIIFTKQYKEEVIENISTGMTNEEIISILGEPTYKNEFGYNGIGYKSDNMYMFFYNGEISVYKKEKFEPDNNRSFIQIIRDVIENKDYDKFVNQLFQIYPDYESYEKNDEETIISYPQKGFKIVFKNNEKNDIIIYNNYEGKITEDSSIEETETLPQYISYINSDAIYVNEMTRIANENEKRIKREHTETDTIVHNTSKLFNIVRGSYQSFEFYSTDKENADVSLSNREITQIYNLTDNLYIYGKRNSGIYMFDAINNTKENIIADNNECDIKKVENYTVYYDNKKIEFSNEWNIINITK